MTNRQMAHKMGLDMVKHNSYEYKDALKFAGMEIIGENVPVLSMNCYEAKMETARGTIHIYCAEDGTARIDKPNGSHKWVYEKTPAQITAQIKQIAQFYK